MRIYWSLIAISLAFPATVVQAADWSPQLAAQYLDSRQQAWFEWPPANTGGTPCLSCHTGLTYLLARPRLRQVLGEKQPTRFETGLISAIQSRLTPKEEAKPNGHAQGVEAVLSALVLTRADESTGTLAPHTLQALDRLWKLQQTSGNRRGAWDWFELKLDPYETTHSSFFGAGLAAWATAGTPESYRQRPDVQNHVDTLRDYLSTAAAGQPLHNILLLALAATRIPGILSRPAIDAIVAEAMKRQFADGGWSMESLGPWMEHPEAKPSSGSSNYATAFATFVLMEIGTRVPAPQIKAAQNWLRSRQDPQTGAWPESSMNKVYPAGSMQELFMSDAATAFAVLSLTGKR